ncbi:hypothetical protein C8J57DRAFT_1308663 [Mycena rebaudengoi]|nr:hypothetical protein C8J57DRAFT_1308663 [Mycena rebaudengoi]
MTSRRSPARSRTSMTCTKQNPDEEYDADDFALARPRRPPGKSKLDSMSLSLRIVFTMAIVLIALITVIATTARTKPGTSPPILRGVHFLFTDLIMLRTSRPTPSPRRRAHTSTSSTRPVADPRADVRELRIGRAPPPNYEKWFAYAIERQGLVDDYA